MFSLAVGFTAYGNFGLRISSVVRNTGRGPGSDRLLTSAPRAGILYWLPTGRGRSSMLWCGMAAGKAGADGAVAQLGERLICTQEVAGSNPVSSTNFGLRISGGGLNSAIRNLQSEMELGL